MNFRTILRENTRPQHDRLDTMFTALDIAHPTGLRRFVDVHLTCFDLMSSRAVDGSYAHHMLTEMVGNLALDLQILGGSKSLIANTLPQTVDPLAIDYLVAGSRLGSQVLQKRWLASANATVNCADNYFGMVSDPSFWRLTCDALAAIEPHSPRADTITQHATILFDLFSTVYQNMAVTEAVA